jgi:hypothetical protein
LHLKLSHYCFMIISIFNLCLWFATWTIYCIYIWFWSHICIVLHFLNKYAFIILLETTDSLRYFCITVSSLYYIILWDMRRRNIRITHILRWILLTIVEASLPPFCGLLCPNPLYFYFENDVYISVGIIFIF